MRREILYGRMGRDRVSDAPAAAAAAVCALFLSFLCCLIYNVWMDELERTGTAAAPPSLLLAFYLSILLLTALALTLIVRAAFAASMHAGVRQLGILSGIGATPRQIRCIMMRGALRVSALPALAGSAAGIGVCYAFCRFAASVAESLREAPVMFHYHPIVSAAALLTTLLSVLAAAYATAIKAGRLTALEAMRDPGEYAAGAGRAGSLFALGFGAEGTLAAAALRAQRKALRLSALSLTCSLLAFSMFLCFITLSRISTQQTYFERYKDCWDLMVTVENAELTDFPELAAIEDLTGVDDCAAYRRAEAVTEISRDSQSDALLALGGYGALAGTETKENGAATASAPLLILDDKSFTKYRKLIGAAGDTAGTVVVNRIWDSANSDFRHRTYVPLLDEKDGSIKLESPWHEGAEAELPIIAFTDEPPRLREEYDDYALAQVISASTWDGITFIAGPEPAALTVRILCADPDALQPSVEKALAGREFSIENRLSEGRRNDAIQKAYLTVAGAFCGMLALIGIANVFSNTLSFALRRRREFARYSSIGVTPAGLRRILSAEALAVAGGPVLLTIPLTAAFAIFAARQSYMDPALLLSQLPLAPIAGSMLAILAAVALGYYIGGRGLLDGDLAAALRDEGMM